MKFYTKSSFSKCDEIYSILRICSHLLKKSLMENFIFCVVKDQILIPYYFWISSLYERSVLKKPIQ